MDIVDGFVILGSVWSIIGGVYLYITYTSKSVRELEEFRQQNISLRAQSKPRDWWQEVLVNISSNPEILEKLIPLVGNNTLAGILQQYVKK